MLGCMAAAADVEVDMVAFGLAGVREVAVLAVVGSAVAVAVSAEVAVVVAAAAAADSSRY